MLVVMFSENLYEDVYDKGYKEGQVELLKGNIEFEPVIITTIDTTWTPIIK
jgi:hypothetical protein